MMILDALALPITMNNHQMGVTPQSFDASTKLQDAFKIISTNTDRQGIEFVSMVEHVSLPIWAAQFHPEKNIFEQGEQLPSGLPYEVIQHTRPAVAVAQYFVNFFVNWCRLSQHRFASAADGWDRLIYKYNTSMTMSPEFVQVYLFEY